LTASDAEKYAEFIGEMCLLIVTNLEI